MHKHYKNCHTYFVLKKEPVQGFKNIFKLK